MSGEQDDYRVLPVRGGLVPCLPGREETVEHCRFCVHSRYFLVRGEYHKSPALVYCLRHRDAQEVDMKQVEAVKCADRKGEGYRSMMTILG
ncbi:MAG: hypothetical protein NQU46_03485 [Methanolinea sp.]|nr:hypothetical protein [Methanolinea sp.]